MLASSPLPASRGDTRPLQACVARRGLLGGACLLLGGCGAPLPPPPARAEPQPPAPPPLLLVPFRDDVHNFTMGAPLLQLLLCSSCAPV